MEIPDIRIRKLDIPDIRVFDINTPSEYQILYHCSTCYSKYWSPYC